MRHAFLASFVSLSLLSLLGCAGADDTVARSNDALVGADGTSAVYVGTVPVNGRSFAVELTLHVPGVTSSKLVEANDGLRDLRVEQVTAPSVTSSFVVKDADGSVIAETGESASTVAISGTRSADAVRALMAGTPLLALAGQLSVPGLTATLGGTPVRFAADFYGTPVDAITVFGLAASYQPLTPATRVDHHFLDDPSAFVDSVVVTVDRGAIALDLPATFSFSADIGADDRSTTNAGAGLANDVTVQLTRR